MGSFKVKVLSQSSGGASHLRTMTRNETIPTAQPMTSEAMRSHASTSGNMETVSPLVVASRPVNVAVQTHTFFNELTARYGLAPTTSSASASTPPAACWWGQVRRV